MGWMPIQEAANALGKSRATLDRRIANDEVPACLSDDGRRMVWVEPQMHDCLIDQIAELQQALRDQGEKHRLERAELEKRLEQILVEHRTERKSWTAALDSLKDQLVRSSAKTRSVSKPNKATLVSSNSSVPSKLRRLTKSRTVQQGVGRGCYPRQGTFEPKGIIDARDASLLKQLSNLSMSASSIERLTGTRQGFISKLARGKIGNGGNETRAKLYAFLERQNVVEAKAS